MRRFQFSIRSLLVLTTLVAVACAIGTPIITSYMEESSLGVDLRSGVDFIYVVQEADSPRPESP